MHDEVESRYILQSVESFEANHIRLVFGAMQYQTKDNEQYYYYRSEAFYRSGFVLAVLFLQ